ncbi:MAG: GPW/gp25 family protein [bacterium]|nr:GPW/gp25 family protein [bacterium]
MTTLNEITYVDWQLKLNEIGSVSEGIEDINQCIAIILSTQKGSVPHRPTFGSDILKYVDYPINSAKANIIRETVDAITLWETRVNVDSVSVEIDKTQLKIKVQWSLKEDSSVSSTAEVSYDKIA